MLLDKNEYLSHINRQEDRVAMRRVLDLIESTITRHTVQCTDFLEPNLIELSQSILNRFTDIKYSIDGGFNNAERQMICIYPWYHFYNQKTDLNIKGISITGNIQGLRHSDVLGSILGLGIIRDKIGDIAFFDEKIKVAVHTDVYDFVLGHLGKIGREYVSVDPIGVDQLGEVIYSGTTKMIIAASMRLDALVSGVYNISRAQAKDLISKDLVKLNHRTENRSHIEGAIGDLVSTRGYGRFRVESLDGVTRSDRIRLTVFQPE